MEIQVDGNLRVLVCWDDRGPYMALDRDGTVSEQFVPVGEPVWTGGGSEDSGSYDDGYADGVEAAAEVVRDLHYDSKASARRTREAAAAAAARAREPKRRPVTTVNLPGGEA